MTHHSCIAGSTVLAVTRVVVQKLLYSTIFVHAILQNSISGGSKSLRSFYHGIGNMYNS